LLTPARAEREVGERTAAEEVFLAQAPRCGEGREDLPLVPRREARGTVSANDAGEEVLVGEAVVRAPEERDEHTLVLVRAWQRGTRSRTGAKVVDTELVGDESLRESVESSVVEVRVLVTADDLELVARAKARRVREQLLEILVL